MAKTPISTSCLSVAGGSFRIPPPHEGLQVNSCRNPECSNFGVEALAQVTRGRPKAGSAGAGTDLYTLSGHKGITPDSFLKCRACNRTLSIKSNRAIAEELERISMYRHPRPLEDVCRTSGCENGLYSVTDHPDRYASQGARGKSHRYRCKSCKKTFSVSQAAHLRQRAPHENRNLSDHGRLWHDRSRADFAPGSRDRHRPVFPYGLCSPHAEARVLCWSSGNLRVARRVSGCPYRQSFADHRQVGPKSISRLGMRSFCRAGPQPRPTIGVGTLLPDQA